MQSERFTTTKNIVVLALDDRMVYGFHVLAHSLVATARSEIFIVVGHLSGKLSPKNRAYVKTVLSWCGIDHEIVEYQPHELFTERRHLTATTFLKFVISDELSNAHLWLDIDTMVTPGWDTIFDEMRDAPDATGIVVAEKIDSPHTRFDGFNAGVLGWTASPRQKWLPTLASLPEKRFSSEQYLFNILYTGRTSAIAANYNFLSSWHEQFRAEEPPKIVHYSGPLKPWHLHRVHALSWRSINPTWQLWFSAEERLLADIKHSPLARETARAARKALFSGRTNLGKGSSASWLLKIFAILGPVGSPIGRMLARRRSA